MRSLARAGVEVGEVIVSVDGAPATLENWTAALRELGREHWEEHDGDQNIRQQLPVILADGRQVDLEVTGRSKVLQPDRTWRYGASTGATVAEGADAPLLPEPPPPPPPAPPVPYEEMDDNCRRVHDLFGPRPAGAPCWYLLPREERELTRMRRAEAIEDPDRNLPYRTDWPFSPGVEDIVPPHRTPLGYGYEGLPDWVVAGAYQVAAFRIACPQGGSRLLGSAHIGSWAIHAHGCVEDGTQTAGALIYAQPDPYDCTAGPLPLTECRTGRVTLMQLATPDDGIRPDLLGATTRPGGTIEALDGDDRIVVSGAPGSVPYLESRAIPIG